MLPHHPFALSSRQRINTCERMTTSNSSSQCKTFAPLMVQKGVDECKRVHAGVCSKTA